MKQAVIAKGELVTWQDYAEAITESWQKSVQSIIETGQRLIDAKGKLEHGDFLKMFEERAVPFSDRTGQMLMAVARHPVLANTKNSSLLPAAWYYLYELTTLPEGRIAGWIGDGTIHAGMKGVDVTKLRRLCAQEGTTHAAGPIAGKYRVFYADPPWQYNNKGMDYYGHAERHYQTMGMEQLSGLADDIKNACEENAVLFLWATSPMLPNALELVDKWGFKYKTSLVWDKVKHMFGHYFSVRHELLLVATKGSCKPDVTELHDSVVSIEKTTKHSEKPAYFRELIDRLYPRGNRIELFARERTQGWGAWGDQSNRICNGCGK